MSRAAKFAGIALTCVGLAGCYRGYKSAKELEADERGPKACAASCKALGLEMSAFVLVERQTSGCVCSPPEKKTVLAPPVAAAAATQVIDQQKQKATEQQRREEAVPTPPP